MVRRSITGPLFRQIESRSNTAFSSTPLDLQTVETVRWTSVPGKTDYVVVDGYAEAEGSYTIQVDCACQ